ncbi:hypothetical protein ACC685_33450 [Rhizobium ruizarguesonis]
MSKTLMLEMTPEGIAGEIEQMAFLHSGARRGPYMPTLPEIRWAKREASRLYSQACLAARRVIPSAGFVLYGGGPKGRKPTYTATAWVLSFRLQEQGDDWLLIDAQPIRVTPGTRQAVTLMLPETAPAVR